MWVVFLFVFGFVVPGINNWGHGGGLLAGIGLGFLLGYREKRRENILHKLLARSCALATLLVLAWAVARTLFFKMMV
jgi:rhomboid protease GluP